MILRWSYPALFALKALHWTQAARIDAAVQRLARSGEGDVFQYRSDNAVTARLWVPPYVIRFTADAREGTILVLNVYRAPGRLP
jgi:hypothetical protein